MPKPASGQMIPQSSKLNVPQHRTLLGFRIALHFLLSMASNSARMCTVMSLSSLKGYCQFFEQSHPAGLVRSHSNTDILLDRVNHFYCPMDFYVLFFWFFLFVFVDINSSDLKYELRRSTCLPFHNSNSDFDIAVAHFRASRPGMQASKSECRSQCD
jgi:hypothetical protein